MERFPNVDLLAEASEEEVLKYWQGLGYYSRARNLHAAARQLQNEHNGQFPKDYQRVLQLKGIGEYTAAAICSFAYEMPYAVLDGNVYRVLARVFGIQTPINQPKAKREFSALAQTLLNLKKPALHNQAIMEFGALQCVPASPDCAQCPLQDNCVAFDANLVNKLPVKIKTIRTRNRYFHYIAIINNGHTYLCKREGKDIWKNLYEFPLIENDEELDAPSFFCHEMLKELLKNTDNQNIIKKSDTIKHVLSHQVIHATFYLIAIDGESEMLRNDYLKIPLADIHNYPVSRLMEMFIEKELTQESIN
jgi:A/G-specific adenine glycosylase